MCRARAPFSTCVRFVRRETSTRCNLLTNRRDINGVPELRSRLGALTEPNFRRLWIGQTSLRHGRRPHWRGPHIRRPDDQWLSHGPGTGLCRLPDPACCVPSRRWRLGGSPAPALRDDRLGSRACSSPAGGRLGDLQRHSRDLAVRPCRGRQRRRVGILHSGDGRF